MSAVPAVSEDRSFLGHPRGLAFISFTEAWERFSYYGMTALLVLYMTKQLLLPGHVEQIAGWGPARWFFEHVYGGGKALSVIALASSVYAFYSSSVYLTPILGGLLADQVGRTR